MSNVQLADNMTTPIYRFFLQIEDRQRHSAHPIYKYDVTLDYQKDNNAKYFRRNLNGRMTFVRDDYDYIMSATYDQTIYFIMEISDDLGLTYTQYWVGSFARTDCTIDHADQTISVQPSVVDDYNDILKGIDKEFNLVELLPQMDRVRITKRPMVQMYVPGDNVVSCFLNNMNWEDDADEVTSEYALVNNYHFGLNTILKEIEMTSVGGLSGAAGTYTGRIFLTDAEHNLYAGFLYEKTGNFAISVEMTYYQIPTGGGKVEFSSVTAVLERRNTSEQLYVYNGVNTDFANMEFDMNPVSGSGMSGKMHGDMKTYNVYSRIILDVESWQGNTTFKIPTDDMVFDNRNYRRCYPYTSPSAYLSNNYSTTPTKYGRRDDGTYFDKPSEAVTFDYFPIAQSTWRYASLWYADSVTYIESEIYGRKQYILRDAYDLASCISVLVDKIAPMVGHQATTAYSEFLYSTTNPVSGDVWKLMMTQKTNILKGEYSEPASKAMCSLQTIFDMLRNAFQCYWFVENGKLRIEHISWFLNGGSYNTDVREIGYDLTSLINIRNGKPWAYGQGEVTYDKQDLPKRYEYSWMDESTLPFDGYPIEIESPNVDEDKVEDVNISNFTSDVDFMLLQPSSFGEDGFALMAVTDINVLTTHDTPGGAYGSTGTRGVNNSYSTPLYPMMTGYEGMPATIKMQCGGSGTANASFFDANGEPLEMITNVDSSTTEVTALSIPAGATYFGFVMLTGSLSFAVYSMQVSGGYELPFVARQIGNIRYSLQNGYLAMVDLIPKYLTYDMPSRNIKVNDVQTSADGLARKAKQTVKFPADAVEIDTNKQIRTLVGVGEIQSLSVNLSSRIISATLNYDNDI